MPKSKFLWRAVMLIGFATAFAAAATWEQDKLLLAQQTRPALGADPNAVNAENFDGKESNEGVYVPESELAMERLALAQKMERLKEWNKSADLYQEILTDPKYTSKVVPARKYPDGRIYQYTSVEELVMQHLAHWPQEGLDVYRARYEAPASAMLGSVKGDDLYTLHQVFARYFVTDAGKTAGIRLTDHYLESGEFRAAASIADRLLQWHPDITAERGAVLYRAALAYHLAGDDAAARQRMADLMRHDAQAKGIVRGKEVLLAESLKGELNQPAPTATGSSADSYTTFGGDSTRNRILAVSGTPGAHLYSIALPPARPANGPQPQQVLEARYREDLKNGMTLGIMPVIDRGELFFQDGQRIYAVNLESGVPLSGWEQSNGADHDGAYMLPGANGSPRTHQLTLTVTDRAVLAVMGQEDANLSRFGVPQRGEARLVCVDRDSGRQNWIATPSQFHQESLRTLQLGGSPLVAGDNVLVVATASKQAGFEDCYVVCFDINKGTLRWATNIASSSTAAAAWAGFNPNFMMPENEAHLAYANGYVYVQTNRGAVAAVDAYNGTIAWIDIYQRGQQAVNPAFNPMLFQQGQYNQNQTRPWAFNPVMVSQGMVFTLPLEGKNLLIYDAVTGAEVKRIDLDDLAQRLKAGDIDREDFDTLVGITGDMLVLASSKVVVALNWKKYDSDHYNDDTMLFWDEPAPQPMRGRPFLTQDQLYLPMEDRLYMLNLRTGRAEKEYPQYPRTWGDDEGPGNIVVVSDHAVIAGAERVDVYTDLSAARGKLDREVADAPNDPQPRLRYAEVMYAAGDYDTSMAKLDEAITRLGGPDGMQPGPVRDRVFNDALTFAQKLKVDERTSGRERVEKLFDRAAQAALSPQQQVHYRMARAGFDEAKGDLAAAAALYQQVLSDADMRAVSLPDEAQRSPVSADVLAGQHMAQLIKRDPSVYEPFETQAAEALTAAQESHDPAKLLSVAQIYPNSTVALKAMLLASDASEAAGDLRSARHVLLDIYFNHDNRSPDRALVLEGLARTDPRTAAHMLSVGIAELGNPKLQKPLKLTDGSELPAGTAFSAALQQVRKAANREQAKSLPAFRLPVPPRNWNKARHPFLADSPVIPDIAALVVPLRDFSKNDRIVTWSTAPLLKLYAPDGRTPVSTTDQVNEQPKGCAWIGNDLLIWGPTRMWMLKGEGPDVAWKLDIGHLPVIEVVAGEQAPDTETVNGNVFINRRQVFIRNGVAIRGGAVVAVPAVVAPKPVPGGPEQIDQVVPVNGRVILSTTNGRVLSVETTAGHTSWQTRLTDRPIDRLLADEDFTVVQAQNDSEVRLAVLDTFTGHVRGTRSFLRASNGFPQNVALSPDGTLVYTLPDRLRIQDLYKPWTQKPIEKIAPPGQASFFGLTGPEQLLISEGRVLALTDTGNMPDRGGEKFIRLYSLQTGNPVMMNIGAGQQVERALSAGTKSTEVKLRLVGSRLYTIAPDACNEYDLDHADQHVTFYGQEATTPPIWDVFLGSDDVLGIGADPDAVDPQPAPNPAAGQAQPQPAVRQNGVLYAFGRYQLAHGEGTRLDYQIKIADPAGITNAWQPFDGGICYLTADHKLHMMLGAKQ